MSDTTPSADRERDYDGGYMAAGKDAEELVMAWWRKRDGVVEVIDYRADVAFQAKEIDCRVVRVTDAFTVEIKSDQHLGVSGNFLFELLRINHTAQTAHSVVLGWSVRSEADVLCYYAPTVSELHVIKMVHFRQAMQRYTFDVRRGCAIDVVPTDQIKSTVNILIPEEFVLMQPSYKKIEIVRQYRIVIDAAKATPDTIEQIGRILDDAR